MLDVLKRPRLLSCFNVYHSLVRVRYYITVYFVISVDY